MKIGAYQLGNLLRNQIKFVYLDFRSPVGRAGYAGDPALLAGVKPAEAKAELLANLAKDAPIVLLCDDGLASAAEAEALEGVGFINVFVIEGGARGLGAVTDSEL